MNTKHFKRTAVAMAGIGLGSILLVLLVQKIRAAHHTNQFETVLLTGFHHMGPDFNISDFYVNGYAGSNVSRGGGGGGAMCCILLPKKWRPGLVAEVRWQVGDWTHEHETIPAKGTFNNARWESYKAVVPIEAYATPERMYVHFFHNGRVRVVSSFADILHADHPVAHDDPSAATKASQGVRIPDIFSEAELQEREARFSKRRMW
jgi:hypothetical protein